MLKQTTPKKEGKYISILADGLFHMTVAEGTEGAVKRDYETSALKSGFDFVTNIMFVSKYLQNIYINITPYYQTDFAGTANIYGNVLSFSPYNSFLHLGGDPTSTTSTSKYFHANKIFWQFSPEFISAHVNTVGTTFLQNGSRFLGGVNVFGNFNFDIYKINKITFKVGREFLVDALSDKTVNYFLTSLSVPLASSSSDNPGKSVTPKLTFEYARGTDKDTLYSTNQFKISLSGTY